MLRDQFRGEWKVKIGNKHENNYRAPQERPMHHRKCGEALDATVLCLSGNFLYWIESVMSEHESRLEILRFGKMLHERGLIAATDGNISVRLNEASILATP